MKKALIILTIFLAILSNGFSKEIKLTIDKEEIILTIPDNTKDLEQAYIDAFTSYIQTKNNLQKMKEIQARTQSQLDKSDVTIEELMAQNSLMMDLLDNRPKAKTILFRPDLKIGLNYSLDKDINFLAGVGVTFFEWVNVGLLVQLPDPINFGILVSIYLR